MTLLQIRKLYASKLFFGIEIGYLLFLPLGLIYLLPEFVHFRMGVFILGFLYVFSIIMIFKFQFTKLGLQTDNFVDSLRSLIAPTLFIALANTFFHFVSPHVLMTSVFYEEMVGRPFWGSALTYGLLSVPLQEILFRSFLITRLELVTKNSFFIILFSSIIFSLIHVPLENFWLIMGTFVLGVVYAINFLHYRNVLPIMLSHFFVGTLFIYYVYLL